MANIQVKPIGDEHRNNKLNFGKGNQCIFIAIVSFFMITGINCEQTKISNPSTLLYEFSEAVLDFLAIEEEVREALLEKPLTELIKSQLRPVEERVASLQLSLSQLSKMKSPKKFLFATETELEVLNNKLISADADLHRIVEESSEKRTTVLARTGNIVTFEERISHLYNYDRQKFDILQVDRLNFKPVNFKENEIMEMEKKNMTFSETGVLLVKAGFGPEILAAKLKALSKLIARREELFEGTTEAFKAMGAKDFVEGYDDPEKMKAILTDPVLGPHLVEQYQVCQEILKIIQAEGQFMNLTVRWILETGKVIQYLMEEVLDTDINIKLYLQIRDDIMEEINEMKKKIEKVMRHSHEEL